MTRKFKMTLSLPPISPQPSSPNKDKTKQITNPRLLLPPRSETDKNQYSQGSGQKIGAGAPGTEVPAMITNGMYSDEAPYYESLYGQDNPDMSNFHNWGHFSQIVWRNTREVGCATVQCATLQNTGGGIRPYFTVCNYAPPGNFGGQYTSVGTGLGKPTVTV